MPWHIGKSKQCPASKPFAVIKDGEGKVQGCHSSEAKAKNQLSALYASEERSMNRFEKLLDKITGLFETEIERESTQVRAKIKTRSTVQRQSDGQHRLFSVSAVSTVNRVGEIDARSLFDSFIEDWLAGDEIQRDFMHLGPVSDQFVTGDVDFMARDGNVLVTSTLYRDTPLAHGEIQSRLKHPEYWGDSIAYFSMDAPELVDVEGDDVQVFNSGTLRFVSTVPEELAASHFTAGNMEQQEVGRMWNDLSTETKDALAKVLGDTGKAQAAWSELVDPVNRQIEDEELVTRAQETETDEPVVEPEVETEYVEQTVELDDAAVDEVARRVAEAETVKALFTPLMERISQLEDTVQALSEELKERDKNAGVLREDVAELQRSEDEKFIEMVDDYPRSATVTATYRPRANTNDEVDVSLAEQADSAIESWGSDGFYKE
jgi:hypothetical protein